MSVAEFLSPLSTNTYLLGSWILTYFGSSVCVCCGCHGNVIQRAACCFIFSPALHFSPVCVFSLTFSNSYAPTLSPFVIKDVKHCIFQAVLQLPPSDTECVLTSFEYKQNNLVVTGREVRKLTQMLNSSKTLKNLREFRQV